MIKDAMEKNEKATPNGADLEVLKKHFGMCFNRDGSLDLEKLKALLGDQVAICANPLKNGRVGTVPRNHGIIHLHRSPQVESRCNRRARRGEEAN